MAPVLVLSRKDVAAVTRTLPADNLCQVIGSAMYAVTHCPTSAEPAAATISVPPVQNPLRIATESESHKILYMPSRLVAGESATTAIKVVSVPKPNCTEPGLPATTLVFDEGTGAVRAMVNSSELTGLRTAAASALATKLLAKPDSKRLLVFGTGVQAYYHARLITQLFSSVIAITFVARSSTERAKQLVSTVQTEYPKLEVQLALSEQTSLAVREADIICCCVPSTEPVFDAKDLASDVHINAIGSYTPKMQEFPPSLISPSEAGAIPRILVDSRDACIQESGEIIASGIAPDALVELGQSVDAAGNPVPDMDRFQLRSSGRSLFKCVGVGAMDVAATALVVELAGKAGIGRTVEF